MLNNHGKNLNIAVIGASGGIGTQCVALLDACDHVKNIYAFSRSGTSFDSQKVTNLPLDIIDEKSVKTAADKVKIPLNIIIVATGILHSGRTIQPEKNLKDISINTFESVFAVNTYGPVLVMKYFLPLLPKDQTAVFAAISARVGSISDNQLGGWYAYRASKAALNMIIKTASIEVARKYKQAAIIGLHPGTVNTTLSKPFQSQVEPEKLFSPQQSATYLLNVINGISPKDTGKCFAWNGEVIKP